MEFELEQEWNRKVESLLKAKEQKLICPDCGAKIVGHICQNCGKIGHTTEHFEDPDFDEYFDKVDKECETFFTKELKWEEVPDNEPIPEIQEPTDDEIIEE